MKIRILDRILVAVAGLLVLAGCAALAAQLFFGKNVAAWAGRLLADPSVRIWLIVSAFSLASCFGLRSWETKARIAATSTQTRVV